MLTAENTPLVTGVRPHAAMSKPIRIKVLRPFLIAGRPQPKDSEIEVDAVLAGELISANKAERAPQPAPAPVAAKTAAKKE